MVQYAVTVKIVFKRNEHTRNKSLHTRREWVRLMNCAGVHVLTALR